MGNDVHSCNVRNELPEAILLSVEDQATFLLLGFSTEAFGTQKNAKLERHIKSGQFAARVKFSLRYVMYFVAALLDYSVELI